jgi:hypothetical protein
MSLILNLAPRVALKAGIHVVSLHASGMSSRDHGTNVASAEGVDARVRHALPSPLFNHPVSQERVELAGGCFRPYKHRLR